MRINTAQDRFRVVEMSVWLAMAVVLGCLPTLQAATRKGDALIAMARQLEAKDTTADLEKALELAQKALETDRLDIGYQVDVSRLRAFAAQYHVYDGQVLRDQGKLNEALIEFQKAAALDPASQVAPQEVARTQDAINLRAANPKLSMDELLQRPLPRKNRLDEDLYSSTAPVPRLKLDLTKPLPVIKVNNQPASEVFRARQGDQSPDSFRPRLSESAAGTQSDAGPAWIESRAGAGLSGVSDQVVLENAGARHDFRQ